MTCGTEPDDFYITEDSRCSGCGYFLDESELETLTFVVEESGVTPGSPDHPAEHWAVGYILCPGCGVELPFEVTTSDTPR